jgi:hypothetical protein
MKTILHRPPAGRIRFWWVPLLLWLIVLGSRVGPIMHESDQASLLDGAWQLAHSQAAWFHPGFYEYDKFYLSYGLLAGVFRLVPSMPVLTGNVFSFAVFAVGGFFAARMLSRRTGPGYLWFLGCMMAPSILVHVPYAAPNFLSLGFLFAGVAFAGSEKKARRICAAICWMVAAGCRMDMLLVWPLLLWSTATKPSVRELFKNRYAWMIVVGGVGMFAAGRLLAGGPGGIGYAPFFSPKIFLAYTAFGLGGSVILLLGTLVLLGRCVRNSSAVDDCLFWLFGVASVVAPFLFYSLFLFSTRHWTVGLGGLVVFAGSRFFTQSLSGVPEWGRRIGRVALFFGVLLLFVGIRLPALMSPSLTLREASLFPSMDGRIPMGAVLQFLFSDARQDHNQALWKAACSIESFEELDGAVPLLESPLKTIMVFAVRLRGLRPRLMSLSDIHEAHCFGYIPCRTVLKSPVLIGQFRVEMMSVPDVPMEMAGGEFPSGVLRIGAGVKSGDEKLAAYIRLLHRLFEGNEFVWEKSPFSESWIRSAAGRILVFISGEPFEIKKKTCTLVTQQYRETPTSASLFYCRVGSDEMIDAGWDVPGHVFCAMSVYPRYMQIRKLVDE